jgi:hypothetical protein
VLVAALPGERGGRLGGAGAELLPDDVAAGALLQEPAVLPGGEAAVGDPDDPAQAPVPHVLFHLPDQCRVGGVPGPAPDPDRDRLAGDRQPDDDLRQVITAVLRLAVRAEPAFPVRVRLLPAGGGLAAPVPEHLAVGVLQLEVRRGRVEKSRSTSRFSRSATWKYTCSSSSPRTACSQPVAR